MHSWRVWVLALVGLGIAEFHSGPMEIGIDIITGHMYPVNMFRYNRTECICCRESEFPIARQA
jgi:hypothetical protein